MINMSLLDNLKDSGLQPFPYRLSDKKGYFNNAYYENKVDTGETAGNTDGYFSVEEYFHIDRDDCGLGIFLKNKNLRTLNKGVVILDFDLKGDDEFTVFKEMIDRLFKDGYMNQFEYKNNKKGMHLIVEMSPDDIAKMEFQGKIHRGNSSFVEVLTAGKFVRLCPNDDYTATGKHSINGHIDFNNLTKMPLDYLLSFSENADDKIIFTSKARSRKQFINSKLNLEYKEGDKHFEDENQRLIYKYATGNNIGYENATKLASALGFARQKTLFESIEGFANGKFNELFLGGMAGEQKITPYLRDLLTNLKANRDKFHIKGKYIDKQDMKKVIYSPEKHVLVSAPTGTGKTHSTLEIATEDNLKIVFAMPNVSTVQQLESGDGCKGVYDNRCVNDALARYKKVICTWNKLANIDPLIDLSNHYLILDECHTEVTSSDYRTNVIYETNGVLSRFKKVIRITATTAPLFLEDYDRFFCFIKKDTKKYNARVFEVPDRTVRNTKLVELLERSDCNILCLNNDIAFNDYYASIREDAISWNSKTKKCVYYKELVKTGLVNNKFKKVLCTDIFSAGLNINNLGKWKIIINDFIDTTLIAQFVARLRKLNSIEVDIIRVVGDHKRITFDKDDKIEKMRYVLREQCDKMNDGVIATANTSLRQDSFYTYANNVYEVFEPAISLNCWRTHCKNLDSSQLFELFDEESVKLEVHYCEDQSEAVDEDLDILQAVKELKKAKKEHRQEIKDRTVSLIAELQGACWCYAEDEKFDAGMIKKYCNYVNTFELFHEVALDFTTDKDAEIFTLYKILARNIDNNWKSNEKYRIAKFLYKKIAIGDTHNLKELAEKQKFNATELKKAVEAIFQTEKFVKNKKTYYKFLAKNCKTKYDKKAEQNIINCGAFFR